MEIYNYSGKNSFSTSAIASRRPIFFEKLIIWKNSLRRTAFVPSLMPGVKVFSWKSVPLAFSRFADCCRRNPRTVAGALLFAMVLGIFAATPVVTLRLIRYNESFARSVGMLAPDAERLDVLDQAMLSFAMDGGLYYDVEGNILGEGGLSLVPEKGTVSFKQPVSWSSYTVKAGDTVIGLSKKFGLSNISTIIAANNIDNVRGLMSGQKLRVPSIDGMIHKVSSGESLTGLSVRYSIPVEDLLDVNDLESDMIHVGQELFVPGARMDPLSLQRVMGEVFKSPIAARYRLTSLFGPRKDPFTNKPSRHSGIDMACPTGTPIQSAMSGKVAFTGWSNIYGNYVIVTHYDGYQTLYGHMSKITCRKGASVSQGTQLGLVGSTGYSTGPHLHFSVYKNGKLVDPQTVLR